MRAASCAAMALVVALALAGPAKAWTVEESEGYFYTYQPDETGQYYLTLDCDAAFGLYAISIEGSEPWDPTTSYATDVPTTFVIDSVELPNTSLEFVNIDDTVAAIISEGQVGFKELYEVLSAAQSTVAVSYFDKAMRFDVTGLGEAFDAIETLCWG